MNEKMLDYEECLIVWLCDLRDRWSEKRTAYIKPSGLRRRLVEVGVFSENATGWCNCTPTSFEPGRSTSQLYSPYVFTNPGKVRLDHHFVSKPRHASAIPATVTLTKLHIFTYIPSVIPPPQAWTCSCDTRARVLKGSLLPPWPYPT